MILREFIVLMLRLNLHKTETECWHKYFIQIWNYKKVTNAFKILKFINASLSLAWDFLTFLPIGGAITLCLKHTDEMLYWNELLSQ